MSARLTPFRRVQGDTSGCAKPSVDIKIKVLFWPRLATFILISTGGFAQRDVSPCILIPQDSSGMRGLRLPRQVPRGAGKGGSGDSGKRYREGRDEDADEARVDEEGGGLGGHLEEQDREH